MKPSQKLKFTILSISILTVMAGAAMAPALWAVKAHFADKPDLLVQFIVSLPALFIIITNLCFGALCRLMKTRTLAVCGLLLYVAAGCGAFFLDNIVVILVLRALLGVSVGMIMPLSTGLLAYYFPPEEQSSLMGLGAAMNQFGGVIATLIAGVLAKVGWNYAFLVYLMGLVILVPVLLNLPNERLGGTREGERLAASKGGDCLGSAESCERLGGANAGERLAVSKGGDCLGSAESCERLGGTRAGGGLFANLKRFYPSVCGMLLLMICFFVFPTNFSAICAQTTTLNPITVTVIMVSLDIVAAIVGMCFGRIMETFAAAAKYLAPSLFLLGYLCFALSQSTPSLLLGCFFIGLANGVGVPYLNTIASIKAGRDAATTVMPLLSAALYAGQFLSPLLVTPLSKLISPLLVTPSSSLLSPQLATSFGQILSPQLATPSGQLLDGTVTAPYWVACGFCLIFLAEAFLTRRSQSLPPAEKL